MAISHRAPTHVELTAELKDLRNDVDAIVAGFDAGVTATVGIPLTSLRKDGAIKDFLDDAPGSSLLGLADGVGEVVKGNASNNNAKTDFCAYQFVLPANYKSGGAVTVKLRVKKDTTAATVSDTCDVIAKLVGTDGTLGSDICATAAQAVTTSYATYSFTITPTGLVPGDVLDLRISLNSDDTGGAVNKAVFMSRMWIDYAAYSLDSSAAS